MVLSKINSNVSYPELKSVDYSDLQKETDLYELDILGVDIIIAIGNAKNGFKDQKIVYYPVYLVKPNDTVIQIGLYELNTDSHLNYIDESNNLDVENLDEPLLYTFVTKELLKTQRKLPDTHLKEKEEKEEKEEEKEGEKEGIKEKEGENANDVAIEIPDIRKDIFILTKGVPIPSSLKEETQFDAKDIKEKYKDSNTDFWISRLMKNQNYSIADNEGGGDCLFATIRDAFSSIAQQTTVNKLRNKLAEEANDTIFTNYKEQYDMYNELIVKYTNEIKVLEAEFIKHKQKFDNTIDRNDLNELARMAKEINKRRDELIEEKRMTSKLLTEFKFMKGIDTLDKFKKIIKSCEFWAETWAISTLERILNVKFIILSSEAYKSGDTKNVLQCGQLNDSILQNSGTFQPEFYIILDYTGSHYKTVSYKNKMIYNFTELPYDIKQLIVDKCMEKNAGTFDLIPEFKRFKAEHKKHIDAKDNFDDITESKLRGLYDDDIVFLFYSKSNDKPLPGKGAGETIIPERLNEFAELARIPQWRKKLSNFWVQPFTLENHKWSSVEHYYQASKFKNENPDFYLSFSLDSGTELSKDASMAKSAGGKSGKYKGVLIRPTQVSIDPDFFDRRNKEMSAAQNAKFTQNEDLKKLLLATNTAKLTHFRRAQAPELFDELMMIRDKIRRSK